MKNRNRWLFSLAGSIAASVFAVPAFADEVAHSYKSSHEGFYAFGGVGTAVTDWKKPKGSTNAKSKDKAVSAWRLGLGYRFSDYLGIEVSHAQMARAQHDQIGRYKAKAETLSGIVFWPITERFDLFGKVNVSRTRSSLDGFSTAAAARKDSSESKGLIGLGFGMNYHVTDSLALRVDVDGLDKATKKQRRAAGSGKLGAMLVTAGVSYAF
jgi:opacity protein-like surface antigen